MTVPFDASAWLFCPADRPERYARALESAEVVIIDLEDAVAPAAKEMAREMLMEASGKLDPSRIIVRVNASMSAQGAADIDLLRATHLRTVMLPKATDAEQVEELDGFDVVALCETALGIERAPNIARASNCIALTWGGQDLAVDLGAAAIRDDRGRMRPIATHARTVVRYAAAAAGIPAIDTVWIAIDDLEGLAAEAGTAAEQGFVGKMVIHPRHVDPVTEAFWPTSAQVEAAERIVAAAAAESGAVAFDGQMLDRPVVEQARLILKRAASTRR